MNKNKINGHEYVDLGLPSGLKWATCNIGASSPERCGDYYAWGRGIKKIYDGFISTGFEPPVFTEDSGGILVTVKRKDVLTDVGSDVGSSAHRRTRTQQVTASGSNSARGKYQCRSLGYSVVRIGGRKNGHWEVKPQKNLEIS